MTIEKFSAFMKATVIIMLSILLTDCNLHTDVEKQISMAESYLEEKPDTALTILGNISTDQLHKTELRARYALLKSIAYDKNYIDTTSFEVLQPAIDYYTDEGPDKRKMATLYYQGRIFQNRGEDSQAMKCYVNGLEISKNITDTLLTARMLVAQSLIFESVYNMEAYTANNLEAAILYRNTRPDLRIDCLKNALNGFILMDQKEHADSIIKICRHEIKQADSLDWEDFKMYRLSYLTKWGNKQQIQDLLNSCDSTSNHSASELLDMAYAYNEIGEPEKAKLLINCVEKCGEDYDKLKYLGIAYKISEKNHDYEDALAKYQEFSQTLSWIHARLFDQKAQFSEEQYSLELKAQKDLRAKNSLIEYCIGGIIFLLLGVLLLTLLIRNGLIQKDLLKIKNEKLVLENKNLLLEDEKKTLETENLRHQISDLVAEHERLNGLLAEHLELPMEVQRSIKERVEMLNAILASQIADNDIYEKSFERRIKDLLGNTHEFMNTTRMAFQASHPHFIEYFEQHGLTTDEINYVCLYAIGLKGKEVGNYIQRPSHVNISSAIRKKLGIDKHDTNLGIYVRRLLQSL